MIALGIDPGTAICGYGVVEQMGSRLTPLYYGAVITTKDMAPEMRLKKIYDDLSIFLVVIYLSMCFAGAELMYQNLGKMLLFIFAILLYNRQKNIKIRD